VLKALHHWLLRFWFGDKLYKQLFERPLPRATWGVLYDEKSGKHRPMNRRELRDFNRGDIIPEKIIYTNLHL
jgi:hypothetical protein